MKEYNSARPNALESDYQRCLNLKKLFKNINQYEFCISKYNINNQELYKTDTFDDDHLQSLSRLKHQSEGFTIYDIFFESQKCAQTRRLFLDQIKNQQLKIDQINGDVKQIRLKESELLMQKAEFEQLIENIWKNYKIVLSIGSEKLQEEVAEVLSFLKPNQVELRKDLTVRNKRNTYSQDQKNKILALLKYYSMASLSQLTNITEQLHSKWKTKGTITKKRGGKKITSQIFENQLIQFLQQHRANQYKISFRRFQSEIVLRSKIIKLKLKGSKGFVEKFCKTNHVAVRKINTKIIKQISEQEIIEFDEVGNYTLAFQSDKHVKVKGKNSQKATFTIGLAVTYNGEKLQKHLIWPGSYYDQDIFKSWVREILIPYVISHQTKLKGILVVENFAGHSFGEFHSDLQNINYEVLYLPPNSTSILQPLDAMVNFKYKSLYKQMREEQQKEIQEMMSHQQFIENLSIIWEKITQQIVEGSWNIYKKVVKETKEENHIFDEQNQLEIFEDYENPLSSDEEDKQQENDSMEQEVEDIEDDDEVSEEDYDNHDEDIEYYYSENNKESYDEDFS
ncbi:hypothetical protein ABPG72_009291 [Tetrahymena utriculariae]